MPSVDTSTTYTPRAFSAGGGRPSTSVHAASRDRAEKAQQRDQSIGIVMLEACLRHDGEAFEQRCRQPAVLDRRHERGAHRYLKRHRGERVAPPAAPALDGAAVDANGLAEPFQPRVRDALLQDGDQHDDRGDENATAEEADRCRRLSRAASIDRAAEAETQVVLGAEAAQPALRLASETSRVQTAAAVPASAGASRVGEIAIDGEQEIVESGIGQESCVQRMRPPQHEADRHGQARTQ